jgi:hypothetical protein
MASWLTGIQHVSFQLAPIDLDDDDQVSEAASTDDDHHE